MDEIVKWREWGTSPYPASICVGNASLVGEPVAKPKLAMNYSPHLA